MKKKKYYIEDCLCLTTKRAIRSIYGITINRDYGKDLERPDIIYEYNDIGEVPFLLVTVGENDPEKIVYDPFVTNHGEQNYLICNGCGIRHSKLYLKPDGHTFRCLKCFELTSKGFKPSSYQSAFVRKAEKITRLADKQDDMIDRIWKRDIETKKYAELIADCTKIGLKGLVADLKDLEKVVKNRRPRRKKKPLPPSFNWGIHFI